MCPELIWSFFDELNCCIVDKNYESLIKEDVYQLSRCPLYALRKIRQKTPSFS